MNKSLQSHGIREVEKQLRLRMKNRGLLSIRVEVTRRAGKLRFHCSGNPDEVLKADAIIANWD
jgi:hypothetical protein